MKKGFTLIELLAVIVIMAIILIITIPQINKVIQNSSYNTFKNNEKLIVSSLQTYLVKKSEILPKNENDSIFIPLSDLKKEKVIDDIIDPKDKSICDMYSSGVVITKNSNSYSYTPYLKCNSYTSDYNNEVTEVSIEKISNNVEITLNLNKDIKEITTPEDIFGIIRPSLIDYTTWVLNSSGSQIGFDRNGSTTVNENQIILKENPWGVEDVTWATLENDIESNGDGGWLTSTFNIDNTKTYRYSVWIRRENIGDGKTYFGLYSYNTSNQNIGASTLDGTITNNPYFRSGGIEPWASAGSGWFLLVAYVHPYNYSLTSYNTQTGIYNLGGTKVYQISDFKWLPNSVKAAHRAYLYYSTFINEKQYYYRPRVDLVNGTEPTLEELLSGKDNPNVNGYTNINKTGIINYTVSSNGTYEFVLKRKDNSIYKVYYNIDNL